MTDSATAPSRLAESPQPPLSTESMTKKDSGKRILDDSDQTDETQASKRARIVSSPTVASTSTTAAESDKYEAPKQVHLDRNFIARLIHGDVAGGGFSGIRECVLQSLPLVKDQMAMVMLALDLKNYTFLQSFIKLNPTMWQTRVFRDEFFSADAFDDDRNALRRPDLYKVVALKTKAFRHRRDRPSAGTVPRFTALGLKAGLTYERLLASVAEAKRLPGDEKRHRIFLIKLAREDDEDRRYFGTSGKAKAIFAVLEKFLEPKVGNGGYLETVCRGCLRNDNGISCLVRRRYGPGSRTDCMPLCQPCWDIECAKVMIDTKLLEDVSIRVRRLDTNKYFVEEPWVNKGLNGLDMYITRPDADRLSVLYYGRDLDRLLDELKHAERQQGSTFSKQAALQSFEKAPYRIISTAVHRIRCQYTMAVADLYGKIATDLSEFGLPHGLMKSLAATEGTNLDVRSFEWSQTVHNTVVEHWSTLPQDRRALFEQSSKFRSMNKYVAHFWHQYLIDEHKRMGEIRAHPEVQLLNGLADYGVAFSTVRTQLHIAPIPLKYLTGSEDHPLDGYSMRIDLARQLQNMAHPASPYMGDPQIQEANLSSFLCRARTVIEAFSAYGQPAVEACADLMNVLLNPPFESREKRSMNFFLIALTFVKPEDQLQDRQYNSYGQVPRVKAMRRMDAFWRSFERFWIDTFAGLLGQWAADKRLRIDIDCELPEPLSTALAEHGEHTKLDWTVETIYKFGHIEWIMVL